MKNYSFNAIAQNNSTNNASQTELNQFSVLIGYIANTAQFETITVEEQLIWIENGGSIPELKSYIKDLYSIPTHNELYD